jgi:hypothetical protein
VFTSFIIDGSLLDKDTMINMITYPVGKLLPKEHFEQISNTLKTSGVSERKVDKSIKNIKTFLKMGMIKPRCVDLDKDGEIKSIRFLRLHDDVIIIDRDSSIFIVNNRIVNATVDSLRMFN